jgi:mannose-6-phosphate isomerase-like protein (cupin superfamily)
VDAVSAPDFPGSVGLTALSAYEWEAADGEHGGSPHVHLVCSECYVVTGGRGRFETLTSAGLSQTPLAPGDVVWFQPGTIHRVLNDGDLRVVVVMQNGGLPEAGDAVMTFPASHLASPSAYASAASLLGPDGLPSAERARARRDLAIEGFAELKDASDPAVLDEFYRSAVALVRPHLDRFSDLVDAGPAAGVALTRDRIASLAEGDVAHLAEARVDRIAAPDSTSYGMCGRLHAYDPIRRALL